jgi:hypothetical protein
MFAKLEAWFNTFFLGYAARVSADLATGLVPMALAAGHHLHRGLRPRGDARRGPSPLALSLGRWSRSARSCPSLCLACTTAAMWSPGLPACRTAWPSVRRTQSGRSRHRVRGIGPGQHGSERAACPALEGRGHVPARPGTRQHSVFVGHNDLPGPRRIRRPSWQAHPDLCARHRPAGNPVPPLQVDGALLR